jgi:5'-nucleotidase
VRILLTNDDGIHAPGLAALHHAVSHLGEVHLVAPATVQSAMSHSVTFHRPIGIRRQRVSDIEGIAVEGSPADCVKLAFSSLVPQPIDLVVSGINAGANIGINVIYSGTVAAAMEAGFLGVPAIAVSLHIGDPTKTDWSTAATHARAAIDRIVAGPLRAHSVLNVNIPILDDGAQPEGVRVVPISTSPLFDRYEESENPAGDRQYEALAGMQFRHTPPDSDVDAVFNRWITITPLHFDLTEHERLAAWRAHLDSSVGHR